MSEVIVEEDTLTGVYLHSTFQSSDSGWGIHVLEVNGKPVTVAGETDFSLRPGMVLVAYGEFTEHPRYGRQFKANTIYAYVPDSGTDFEVFADWLRSGVIKHLGPVRAAEVLRVFGPDTPKALSDVQRLQQVPGIGPAIAPEIAADWQLKSAFSRLASMLHGLGLQRGEIRAVTRYYLDKRETDQSLDIRKIGQDILANPYLLLKAPGIGFLRADEIAERLGVPEDSVHRLRAALWYAMEQLSSEEGHTLYRVDWVLDRASSDDILGTGFRGLAETVLEDWLGQDNSELVRPHPEYVALTRFTEAEGAVWERLMMLKELPPMVSGTLLNDVFRESRLAGEQMDAVETAVSRGVGVLTGGPGTGKTTCIRAICNALERAGREFLLMTPSGKAAARVTEATGFPAETIHRRLYSLLNQEDTIRNTGVILDESSMVDALLFAWLLSVMDNSCALLLVGDYQQLPSVGPGRVFGDILDSGLFPVGTLTENHRSAHISGIPAFARMTQAGWVPGKADLPGLADTGCDIVYGTPGTTVGDWVEQLIGGISRRLAEGVPASDIQVLTPTRKGPVGTQNLNRVLRALLTPKGEDVTLGVDDGGPRQWRVGDRVIQVKNWYRDEGAPVFNGEQGVVVSVSTGSGTQLGVRFDKFSTESGTPEVLTYDRENIDQLQHAFALTIHKSQGSEYPHVILLMTGNHWHMATKALLYTGITRARQSITFLGEQRVVRRCVTREDMIRETCLWRYFSGFE